LIVLYVLSDHNAGLLVRVVDLVDGVDEAGVSEGEVALNGELPVFLNGHAHNLLESRVDDVELVSTAQLDAGILEAHDLEKLGLALLLVLLGHFTGGNVVQVLQPFEVGAGDTATVDEHIGGAHDSTLGEDLLSLEGGRAVGTLKDGPDVNRCGISIVDRFFGCGGNHAVGGELSHVGEGVLGLLLSGTGESLESAVGDHVVLDGLHVEALGVVDGRVVLADGGDLAAILLDELGGPVADSAETLDDESLVLDSSGLETALLDEGLLVEELTGGVVNTESGGFSASLDTALLDVFSSAAALSIDVLLSLNVHVRVLDPRHDLLVGSHVGAKAIDGSTDESFLDQLHGVLAGHSLEFALRKSLGVNLDSSLGSTERNVGNGQLEGHEGGEGLDFLEIDVGRVAGASLDGELVGAMLGSKIIRNMGQ
jgi:hypothetical protein